MAPNQMAFTMRLVKQIQDINGNPAFSAQEKQEAIANLKGAPREEMFEYLNNNFRTGPDLAEALRPFVSKNRPRGGPSVRGLLKKVKK